MYFDLTFISSSRVKRAHLKYLCKEYNINIVGQKNYGIGYDEPRILYDRNKLLKNSYKSALKRWKKNGLDTEKIFIFEDTSVIINALSTDDKEIPGLDIKYWMKEHSFDDLDRKLKDKGNDRSCYIRSDIIMHLPKYLRDNSSEEYLQFTGYSKGNIVDIELEFETNTLFPWLDNKTFNKWFIPEGETLPLSLLPIHLADKYDFRKNAVIQMLEFLESHNIIKNQSQLNKSLQKIINFYPTFILMGPTCAGKSTLADFLSNNYNYFHIEASDFMQLKYLEMHGTNSNVNIHEFAKEILKNNPEIVTSQIKDYFNNIIDKPIVISGFRNYDELLSIENSQFSYIEPIFIKADINIRFNREKIRKRKDQEPTMEKFIEKNKTQEDMGLKFLETKVTNSIVNEKTKKDFYIKFIALYEKVLHKVILDDKKSFLPFNNLSLEKAILIALYIHCDEHLTTTQISKIIDEEVLTTKYNNRKNNVSRYFNFKFHPYYTVDHIDGINYYKINYTGKSMAKYIFQKYKKALNEEKDINELIIKNKEKVNTQLIFEF